MKLEIELTNNEWIFKYKVGENSSTSSRPIDAETLCAFTHILKYASEASRHENKKLWDQISAKAWIESHASEALDFANEQIKKAKK